MRISIQNLELIRNERVVDDFEEHEFVLVFQSSEVVQLQFPENDLQLFDEGLEVSFGALHIGGVFVEEEEL